MTVIMRKVGGCVRDQLLGVRTKDIDYSVEIADMIGQPIEAGFAAMREHLEAAGFHIFVETPEHVTIRAQFPRGHELRGVTTADFVLCRKEGPYTDGRRPDYVEVGTLQDDLARRDFTVNAMAQLASGAIIDLHGGQADLANMRLRCVGDPMQRMREDALRALRAVRFCITKQFTMDLSLHQALASREVIEALLEISTERRSHELRLCFQATTFGTLEFLAHNVSPDFTEAALYGLKLNPTTKRRLPSDGPAAEHEEDND